MAFRISKQGRNELKKWHFFIPKQKVEILGKYLFLLLLNLIYYLKTIAKTFISST